MHVCGERNVCILKWPLKVFLFQWDSSSSCLVKRFASQRSSNIKVVLNQNCRESKHKGWASFLCTPEKRLNAEKKTQYMQGHWNQSKEGENQSLWGVFWSNVITFKISSAMLLLSQRESGGGCQISSLPSSFERANYEMQMTQNWARKLMVE